MILCVGALGSGKSTLLKVLQQYGQAKTEATISATEEKPIPATKVFEIPNTTPTAGTDLLTIRYTPK